MKDKNPETPASPATVAAPQTSPVKSSMKLFQPTNEPETKPKKAVQFSKVCKVVLVPKKEEYKTAGINLWWTPRDFLQFKNQYVQYLTEEKFKMAEKKSSVSLLSQSLIASGLVQPTSVQESLLSIQLEQQRQLEQADESGPIKSCP